MIVAIAKKLLERYRINAHPLHWHKNLKLLKEDINKDVNTETFSKEFAQALKGGKSWAIQRYLELGATRFTERKGLKSIDHKAVLFAYGQYFRKYDPAYDNPKYRYNCDQALEITMKTDYEGKGIKTCRFLAIMSNFIATEASKLWDNL